MYRTRRCLIPSMLCALAVLFALNMMSPGNEPPTVATSLVAVGKFATLAVLVSVIAFSGTYRPTASDHHIAMSIYSGVAVLAILTWFRDTDPAHMIATFAAVAAAVTEIVRWYVETVRSFKIEGAS